MSDCGRTIGCDAPERSLCDKHQRQAVDMQDSADAAFAARHLRQLRGYIPGAFRIVREHVGTVHGIERYAFRAETL